MSVLSRGQVWRRMIWKNLDFLEFPNHEAKRKTFYVKMSFICRRIKKHFRSMASISDQWLRFPINGFRSMASLWNSGTGELGPEWPNNNMAANMKDFCCRQLPNHLHNLHLLCRTFLTGKYIAWFKKHKTILWDISREEKKFLDGQNSRN